MIDLIFLESDRYCDTLKLKTIYDLIGHVTYATMCAKSLAILRDAGAMVGQGGRRGTQGHSRPITREANRKLGASGVLPRKNLRPLKMLSRIFKLM